jgi:hypothetical protein
MGGLGVEGFTGIELWNGFSEFKPRIKSKLHALYYAFNPHRIAQGPLPEAIRRWDELLSGGKKVVAIGGSDAHGHRMHLGPIQRTVFPYEFHFRAINTHVLIPRPLGMDAASDTSMILEELRKGHCFIGYDLPFPTRGLPYKYGFTKPPRWAMKLIAGLGNFIIRLHTVGLYV